MIARKNGANILRPLLIVIAVSFLTIGSTSAAQEITVAVADFTNGTGQFRLDSFEKSVPEMLKTELSRIGSIVVVERSKLESVLAEQALNQTGVIDIEDAQKVGQLVGAQYVISGEITWVQSRLRLDAHIVQTQTGKVVGEKVTGPNEQVIEKMVSVLANNIVHNLSGTGFRTISLKIKNHYAPWVLLSAGVSGAVALSFNSVYKEHWQNYEDTTKLNEFDCHYDKANSNYKARNTMLGVTGALLAIGISLWLHNSSENNKILAQSIPNNEEIRWAITPYSDPLTKGFGVQLCYRW